MMQRKTKWILISSLGLVILGGIGWMSLANRKEETVFTVDEVKRQDLRDSVNANGEIQSLTRVNVGVQVTAQIKEIHVKDGQRVKTGDLLVTLDQERYQQELNNAQLGLKLAEQELQNAEATFKKQETTFNRQDALFKQGLLSAEDHQSAKLSRDTASTSLQKARVAVRQGEAQVAIAQDSLSKTVIRATMDGTVTSLKAEKGETAIAGQTSIAGAVLMVISDLSEMLAEVKVGELDVVRLKPGQPAEVQVDAIPGQVFQGKVLDVASSVDRNTQGMGNSQDSQNYRVRIRIADASPEVSRLRPGMSARVAVLSQEIKNALTVPLQAVQERMAPSGGLGLMMGTRPVVFVVKDGKVEERTLKLGASTRRAAEVVGGVTPGEQVITGPAKAVSTLAPGTKVKTQSEKDAIQGRKS